MGFIKLNTKQADEIIKYKLTGEYQRFEEEDPKKTKDKKKKFRDRARLFEYSLDRSELFYVNKFYIKYKFFYIDRPHEMWDFVYRVHQIGHFGRDRLHDLVGQRAYGVHRDICAIIVKNCIFCKQRNNLATKPGYTPMVPKLPRERLIADLVNLEKYVKSNDGYKYLFVSVDSFSKLGAVYPIKTKSAREVHNCFLKYIQTYGPPYIIHTDNGREFKNSEMEELCNKFNIKFVHGLPRYPQSQGQVEWLNKTFKNSISDTIRSLKTYPRWIYHIDEILFNYNSVKHGTTKQSPFDVFFGNIYKMIPNERKKAVEEEIKYYVNGEVVETIDYNIEEISVDIPEEYLSYLLYKDEINKKVKENIEKLGKYKAKRRKWKPGTKAYEVRYF